VDTLLENQIVPFATLYHWDLPAALEDRGGWADQRIAEWFAEYARTMYRALGDRVRYWATLNEPWVVMDQGYITGNHAPGRRDVAEAAAVAKNLLRAHASAVQVGRAERELQIGLVVNLVPIHAASNAVADIAAANRLEAYLNRQFLDPVLLGESPSELGEVFSTAWQPWDEAELRELQRPIDFVGVNYYLRLVVCDDPAAGPGRARIVPQPNCRRTATDWEIYPQGLTDTLLWIKHRYGDLPIFITENGAAFDERFDNSRVVDDPLRVEYLREHLQAAHRAIEQGVNLRGYFVWSLLDNFEWQSGYSKRFGIVYVDFPSQARVPKASAYFYREIIRSRGAKPND
jgi:beta-glucosidase